MSDFQSGFTHGQELKLQLPTQEASDLLSVSNICKSLNGQTVELTPDANSKFQFSGPISFVPTSSGQASTVLGSGCPSRFTEHYPRKHRAEGIAPTVLQGEIAHSSCDLSSQASSQSAGTSVLSLFYNEKRASFVHTLEPGIVEFNISGYENEGDKDFKPLSSAKFATITSDIGVRADIVDRWLQNSNAKLEGKVITYTPTKEDMAEEDIPPIIRCLSIGRVLDS